MAPLCHIERGSAYTPAFAPDPMPAAQGWLRAVWGGLQAAWLLASRPWSQSTMARANGARSAGVRELTRLPSITSASSTHRAPALTISSRIPTVLVARLPRRIPAEIEHPSGVADERDQLSLVVHGAHQVQDARVPAHLVRGEAAGHQERVVVGPASSPRRRCPTCTDSRASRHRPSPPPGRPPRPSSPPPPGGYGDTRARGPHRCRPRWRRFASCGSSRFQSSPADQDRRTSCPPAGRQRPDHEAAKIR